MDHGELEEIKEAHRKIYCELYNDTFENNRQYNIPRAQLILTDIPYNVGNNAYGSNPTWYKGGDINNGQDPKKAGKAFFHTDGDFNLLNFFGFCVRLLKPEPKGETNKAPCIIIFCSFEQTYLLSEYAKQFGFKHSMPLFFIKDYSPQVLKANMRPVGAVEFALLLYRDKLPKFNNNGKMVFNWFNWGRDDEEKIHPTQKPLGVLERLIEVFTDEDDTVIDPCAGSGSTLIASRNLLRNSYGFEISKEFYAKSKVWIDNASINLFNHEFVPSKPRNEQLSVFGDK